MLLLSFAVGGGAGYTLNCEAPSIICCRRYRISQDWIVLGDVLVPHYLLNPAPPFLRYVGSVCLSDDKSGTDHGKLYLLSCASLVITVLDSDLLHWSRRNQKYESVHITQSKVYVGDCFPRWWEPLRPNYKFIPTAGCWIVTKVFKPSISAWAEIAVDILFAIGIFKRKHWTSAVGWGMIERNQKGKKYLILTH